MHKASHNKCSIRCTSSNDNSKSTRELCILQIYSTSKFLYTRFNIAISPLYPCILLTTRGHSFTQICSTSTVWIPCMHKWKENYCALKCMRFTLTGQDTNGGQVPSEITQKVNMIFFPLQFNMQGKRLTPLVFNLSLKMTLQQNTNIIPVNSLTSTL